MTRSSSPASLPKFVGIPYGFRGAGGGLDCWQLVRAAACQLYGLTFPDPVCPRIEQAGAAMREGFRAWLKVDLPKASDVVCLTLAGQPLHTGLVLERGRFLHVLPRTTSRIDRLDGIVWRSRIEGFYRWPASI